MKIEPLEVKVDVRLVLTMRELQLLNHIFSYDLPIKGMVSSYYCGGVGEEELVDFKQNLRTKTGQILEQIKKTTIESAI
jgi:hypothetical protein